MKTSKSSEQVWDISSSDKTVTMLSRSPQGGVEQAIYLDIGPARHLSGFMRSPSASRQAWIGTFLSFTAHHGQCHASWTDDGYLEIRNPDGSRGMSLMESAAEILGDKIGRATEVASTCPAIEDSMHVNVLPIAADGTPSMPAVGFAVFVMSPRPDLHVRYYGRNGRLSVSVPFPPQELFQRQEDADEFASRVAAASPSFVSTYDETTESHHERVRSNLPPDPRRG